MLKLVNVSKYYSANNVIALGLRKVNLELGTNEFVAIVGESGSGKTTLLNVICGIDTYEEGEITVNGEETSYFTVGEMENFRKKYVAFVFQNYNLIDSYTVLQNVEAPLILAGVPKAEIRPRAMAIIRRVGLEKHIRHKATKLSGGQKQRVVIARALAKNAPIIAADEPTGNLDIASAKEVMALLSEIAKDKLVIVVTHDYDQVKDYATRKIRIYDGEIVEDVAVRPSAATELPKVADAETRLSFRDHVAIALRNLFAVPRKTFLMTLVFTVFSFFVAFAYGAFNASMRDFEDWGNTYFRNTSIVRVVLRRADMAALSEADLDLINDDSAVAFTLANDYVLDTNLTFMTTVRDASNNYQYIYPFPLPTAMLEADRLYAGRLPETADEVVLAGVEGQLDDYVEKFLDQTIATMSERQWGMPGDRRLEVVGIADAAAYHMSTADYGSEYIFLGTEAFDEIARELYLRSLATIGFTGVDNHGDPYYTENLLLSLTIAISEAIPDDVLSYPYYGTSCDDLSEICEVDGTATVSDFYADRTIAGLHITMRPTGSNDTYYILVNSATADRLFGSEVYQVSVFAESDVGVDGLVRRLGTMRDGLEARFAVLYPYASQSGEEYVRFVVIFNVLWSGLTLGLTVLGATLITFVIFRAIINTKMHDYAIYRTIGASQRMIRRFIYLENVLTAIVGYVVVATTLIALTGRFEPLDDILKYYNVGTYLVLFLILIGMALIISAKYCRRIFSESVQRALKAE